jgi:hypothetical protein
MPSSFSTDLKLELMVTGENAGTWGTKTNTNLNLLQQAIAGFQSISIAGSAQTTALTMDNAAISNARNAVVKLTGTITGNQVVTVPDGIEKTYIVQNGTVGAFTVEFKTASGTGVTFASTNKGFKIVYSDGTNIVDVELSSVNPIIEKILDTNGNEEIIFTATASAVNELTIANAATANNPNISATGSDTNIGITLTPKGTGSITVNGNLSVNGGTIKLDGNYPVGTNNVALGDGALDDGSLTGGCNVAIGTDALTANTSGFENIAVGAFALDANTSGCHNVAVGSCALTANTTGCFNIGVGRCTLTLNCTGVNNTAIGAFSLEDNTTGNENHAIGREALASNTTGGCNIAIGRAALSTTTTASLNTAVGHNAGCAITTGSSNTIVGTYTGCTTDLDIRTKGLFTVLSAGNGEPVFVTKTISGALVNASYRLMKSRHGLGYLETSGTIAAAGSAAINLNGFGGDGSIGIFAVVTAASDASAGFDSTFMTAHSHGSAYNDYGTALLYTTVNSITIVRVGGGITITNGSAKQIKYQIRYINLGAKELTLAAE